jgi:replicative DNA helicase
MRKNMRRRSEAKSRPQREDDEQITQREFTIDVPNDPVIEQVVLASMMVDTETCDRLIPLVPTDTFYAPEHRVIREAIGEMRRRKLTFDPATLARINPDIDLRLIEQLPAARPDVPPDLDFFVNTLLWDRRRAQATQGPISSLLEAVQNPKEEPDRVRAIARQVAEAFEGEIGQARFLRNPADVVQQMMTAVRRRAEGQAFYPYGIKGLDYYENGVKRLRPGASPGTMTLVTALSGSGKSTFLAHLAIGLARQKRRVLFGAWEEVAPVTLELLCVLVLGWSRSRVLDGRSNQLVDGTDDEYPPLTHEDLITLEETAHKISSWVTFFDNPFQRNKARTARNVTNDDHLDIIHEHLAESGAEIFFADLLHRCFVEDSPSDEKHALFRLLAIGEEQKVHTIAAHQQRAKDIETRADKRPTREGIIGAGAWLDTFWTVLAPHLPAKWKNVDDNTMELYVLKQRNGPWPLGVEFDWNPDTGQISNGHDFDVRQIDNSGLPDPMAPSGRPAARKGFGGNRSR